MQNKIIHYMTKWFPSKVQSQGNFIKWSSYKNHNCQYVHNNAQQVISLIEEFSGKCGYQLDIMQKI